MARVPVVAPPPGPPKGDPKLAKNAMRGSPIWWVHRLHLALQLRRTPLAKTQRYFDGEFDLRYTDQRLRQVFGNVFYADRFGVNWSRLVVSTIDERLQVDGIRIAKAKEADEGAWDIWQANDLDELSSGAHLEALLNGASYATVWPGDDPRWPDITISHPTQAILEVDPGHPRRTVAGLRIYTDAWGYLHSELFMPNMVYLFRSANASEYYDPDQLMWLPDEDMSPDGEMLNPWGVVPMVEFGNVPKLLTNRWESIARRSEIWSIMPIQDLINQTLFNVALVANSQGFRQRWVTGLDLEIDEVTGEVKQPFRSGIDRLFQSESADTKFGEFSSTDVTPLIKELDMLVHNVAAIAQIPPHYLSASADRLSGEALALSTPIPTPSRLTAMGFLREGDLVFDECGKLQHVEHVFEVLVGRDCHRVLFDDDTEIVADADHRWLTSEGVKTTAEIGASLDKGHVIAKAAHPGFRVVAVEAVPSEPVCCIQVSGPSHLYLAGTSGIPTHNSIKAAESGLVAKVKRKQVAFGNSWETVMRLAGLMTGNQALAQARGSEIMWANAETRSEAGMGDAALKMSQIGVPWRAIMEFLGFSPQQIARMETDRATDALVQQLQAVVAPLAPAMGTPSIVGLPPGPTPAPAPPTV